MGERGEEQRERLSQTGEKKKKVLYISIHKHKCFPYSKPFL